MQLVCGERYDKGGEERIRKAWTLLLRSPLQVTFEYVTQLSPDRSGKFRHVVSELRSGRGPETPAEDRHATVGVENGPI